MREFLSYILLCRIRQREFVRFELVKRTFSFLSLFGVVCLNGSSLS